MREKHHFGDTFRETRKNPDKKIGVNRVGECTLNRKMASEKQSSPPEGAKGNCFFSFASPLGRENCKNEGLRFWGFLPLQPLLHHLRLALANDSL